MGMFDWVNFKHECPHCGELLTGFQSKDEYCVLEYVKPHKIKNFYTNCGNCEVWIDFTKEHGSKKWTRTVTSEFRRVGHPEHTKKFSKKYLKEHLLNDGL